MQNRVQSPADHHILQQDLFRLEKWASIWQMNFSPTKCYRLSITLKRSQSSFPYMLCGTVLEGVIHQKYLGVYITCTLSWSKQAQEIRKKANRVLGVLQRNLSSCNPAVKERAYMGLVRPVTEYASVAWSPYTKKDIKCVEAVQRRATRFV